jgi:putative oxidoreductase
MFHLEFLTDFGLLFLRIMVGLIFLDSGYLDLKNPAARAKSIGEPVGFTTFLAIAELAGGAAIILGILQQLAAIGCILIMGGAIQKKLMVWKTGFWGKENPGYYYELTITAMLCVILFTNGGRYVIWG